MGARTETDPCSLVLEDLSPYVENIIPADVRRRVDDHLAVCQNCRDAVEQFRVVHGVLAGGGPRAGAETFLEPVAAEAGWGSALSGAPWWGVSVLLHGLVIALAGLISMAIKLPPTDDMVIMVTEMAPRPKIEIEPERKKTENDSPLLTKHDTPPTDPTSKEFSDIVVPPDILAKAELGDHFETVNPDRPDTQSAFGNPDAKMFHSVQGNDEPEGGGGDGGAMLEEGLIGVGGRTGAGTGGGWGGGNGTGIGVGNGSGRGSFGSRSGGGRKFMVKRHGGSVKTEDAVERALDWLARNQEPDGSWSNEKHGATHAKGIEGDSAMTGFALLAFLGAGHTEKTGKYKEHVKRGVAYLIAKLVDVPGKKDAARWHARNYCNGVACMALGEAAGMSRIKETAEAAQRAINGVDDAQRQTEGTSDREAWDYGPRGGCNDSSIMAWNILALKSCKVAALKVNHSCFEGCLNWINAGQDLDGFNPGDAASYDWEGGKMSYRGTCANPKKGQGGMAVTAAAALCRLMIGGAKGDDPGVLGPCNLIKNKNLPKAYPFSLYYGYYATLLMFQKGGDHWKAWNEAMKKVLLDSQIKGGNDDGSWDNVNWAATHTDSRVMSTALGCLCMEVYYRYAKLAPEN
jgi:hypothetical protein